MGSSIPMIRFQMSSSVTRIIAHLVSAMRFFIVVPIGVTSLLKI